MRAAQVYLWSAAGWIERFAHGDAQSQSSLGVRFTTPKCCFRASPPTPFSTLDARPKSLCTAPSMHGTPSIAAEAPPMPPTGDAASSAIPESEGVAIARSCTCHIPCERLYRVQLSAARTDYSMCEILFTHSSITVSG